MAAYTLNACRKYNCQYVYHAIDNGRKQIANEVPTGDPFIALHPKSIHSNFPTSTFSSERQIQ
jgi:hypothetical protein